MTDRGRRQQADVRAPRRGLLLLALGGILQVATAQAQTSPGISAREAHDAVQAGRVTLVDIRSPTEWADTGVPQGAIRLDADAPAFEVRIAGLRLDHPGRPIALIDRTGGFAASTQQKLAGRGWRDLVAVRGGVLGPGGWLAEKLPVTP